MPPSAEVIAAAIGVTTMPGYVAYTASTDPNHLLGRQGGYTSKVNWGTSDEGTNSIEVYPDASGAQERYQYLKGFQGSMIGDGYDYLVGTALLRLSTYWTPAQASVLDAKFMKAAT